MAILGIKNFGEFEEELNEFFKDTYIHVNRKSDEPLTREEVDQLKSIVENLRKNKSSEK